MRGIKNLGLRKIMRPFQSVQAGTSGFFVAFFSMISLSWKAQPLYFIGLLAIQCIQGTLPVATAWVTKMLFDLLASGSRGQMQVIFLLLALQAALTIFTQILTLVSQYLSSELGRQLSLQVKTSIYQKLSSIAGLTYFEDPLLYDSIQVVTNNAQFSPTQALTLILSLIQGVITISTFLGILLAFSPLIAVIVEIAVLPQVYMQFRFGRQRFRVAVTNSPRDRLAQYYGQVLSWLQFAKEVRLFNLGDYFLQKFVQTTKKIYQEQRNQQKREIHWQLVLSLVMSAVSIGAFSAVIVQAFAGKLSIGDVTLYISALDSVQGGLIGMIYSLSQTNQNALFFRKYTELLNLVDPLPISRTPSIVPSLTSGITLHNVSFRYSEHHPWILRHVNLFLPASKCLALVGLNGAGKTTLVKLLTRMYDPTEGQILWDGIDLRDFTPQELRTHIGTIFQDFAHYDLSVQQNIGLGNATQIENESAVQQAAMKAGIHQRITMLEDGYQSLLSRWLAQKKAVGIDLSGGEWQKVALARMFMREADMLILDEPSAALDAQSEYELYLHFRELMQGKTCLLITHRLNTIHMADTIAVLEDGHVTEYGLHEDLIVQDKAYAKLYAMQAANYT